MAKLKYIKPTGEKEYYIHFAKKLESKWSVKDRCYVPCEPYYQLTLYAGMSMRLQAVKSCEGAVKFAEASMEWATNHGYAQIQVHKGKHFTDVSDNTLKHTITLY